MRSLGLVLSGGGVRGSAHIGVLQALHEANIKPTYISGTSAGSIVAGLYAYGYSPQEMLIIAKRLSRRSYDLDYPGIITSLINFFFVGKPTISGLVQGDYLERYFTNLTKGCDLKSVKMPLAITAVDINNSKIVVFTSLPVTSHLSAGLSRRKDLSAFSRLKNAAEPFWWKEASGRFRLKYTFPGAGPAFSVHSAAALATPSTAPQATLSVPAAVVSSAALTTACTREPSLKDDDYVFLNDVRLAEAIRASIAIPGIFKPKMIQKMRLVDGGIRANLPVEITRMMGAQKVIAVNLSYNGRPVPGVDNILEISLQAIDLMVYQITRPSIQSADIIITPEIEYVQQGDLSKIDRLVQSGYQATMKLMPRIRQLVYN